MIIYTVLEYKNFDKIEELWIRNQEYHLEKSVFFKKKPGKNIFQKRVAAWESASQLKYIVAEEDQKIVAFCISSINNGIGAIESLFVETIYRRQGIANELMRRHLEWMNSKNCSQITVTTVYNNSEAMDFYKSVGLYPKTVTMVLK